MRTGKCRIAILSTIGVVVALILCAALVVMFQLGAIIRTAVVKVGPTFTGAPIQLESVTIRPLTGKAIIRGLVIGNPEGFKAPTAFELNELKVDLEVLSVFTGTIVIHDVLIDSPRITYEQAQRKSNIEVIMANVQKRTTGQPKPKRTPSAETPPPKPSKAEKNVIIDRLVISNGMVKYGDRVPLPLPTIALNDIGKDEEMTMPETVALVVGEIINGVGTAFVQAAQRAGKGLQKSGARLAELARDKDDVAQDAASGVGRAADDVRGVAHKGLRMLGLDELIEKPKKMDN